MHCECMTQGGQESKRLCYELSTCGDYMKIVRIKERTRASEIARSFVD